MNNNNKHQYSRQYYVEGSAVRQLQELPRYNDEEQKRVIVNPKEKAKRKPKRSPAIDFFSFMVLTGAIILTLYTCIDYLGVQSGITSMNNQIAKLESKLTKLQNENSSMESMINTSLDLNYIYQIATTELGMVYPNENQVINYESTLSDYVRQYENIPDANEKSIFDKFKK
jgi:cell division protein FtsL